MIPLLKDVRIVDLTTVIMGPFATQHLGTLGAEVIKVERPGGDAIREISPARNPGMGALFLNVNRNKKSLCLDLKRAEARAVLERVIVSADVLIHNMRRPAARRLGLDYASLKDAHPRLVHCTAVGFGPAGPYADRAAYDDIVQAASGLAAVNAGPDGAPRYVPSIIADKISGLYVVQGVLAALHHRDATGEGVGFEVSMMETVASFLLAEHMGGHVFEPPIDPPGYKRLLNPYRKPYRTADGFVAAMPQEEKHWRGFLALAGREDVLGEPWFADTKGRSEHVHELYQLLEEAMPQRTTADWLVALEAADIPCGPVNGLEDLFTDPQLAAGGFFDVADHETEGVLRHPAHPLRFEGVEGAADTLAPQLGADNRTVLHGAGFSEAEIDDLATAGVLASGGKRE